MRAEEVRQVLYKEPFRPFRVRVRDGRTFDIRYPELNLVGESVFIIGIPELGPNPRFAERQEWIPLQWIDGLDPLPEPADTTAS